MDIKLKNIFKEIKNKKNCQNCIIYKKEKNRLFQFYNLNAKPKSKIMIIMQNPGIDKNKGRRKKLKKYYTDNNVVGFIRTCQDGFKNWNKRFFEEFFNILCKELNLKFAEMFNAFYITDTIKCESSGTKEVYYRDYNKRPRNCCFAYLKKEIKLVRPNLIITFGNESFNTLYEKYGLKPVDSYINLDNIYQDQDYIPVTKTHGYLFKFNKKRVYILPLYHLSKKYMTLRNTYFQFFKIGLKKYKKLK